MTERFIIERRVEREAVRESIWWTVRDRVTGYLKDCRSEQEALTHLSELNARISAHLFPVVEYVNQQGSHVIAAQDNEGSWHALCLVTTGCVHQFVWTQGQLDSDMEAASQVSRRRA